MTGEDLPVLEGRYSRLSQFGFGVVFLIFLYGGIGMVLGFIAIEDGQRLQQIVIGLVFLVLAAGFGLATTRMFMALRKPVLTLDRNGLWDRRLTTAPIPWTAIARIEAVEPGFVERILLPGAYKGTLAVHVRPEAWDAITFASRFWEWLNLLLFAGRGRLRLFYRALDLPYQTLIAALEHFSVIERRR